MEWKRLRIAWAVLSAAVRPGGMMGAAVAAATCCWMPEARERRVAEC